MRIKHGNMLAHIKPDQYYLVTANSTLRKDGALVMGRGAAFQLKKLYPIIPYHFGKLIRSRGKRYGIVIYKNLGIFQVKYFFKSDAVLGLIAYSAQQLHSIAVLKPKTIFNVNYPGIGYGHLDAKQVYPIIKTLPKNVIVWRYK